MTTEKTIRLFGGETTIALYDIPPDIGEEIMRRTETEALRLQAIFNLYDPDSELNHLNKKRNAQVSEEIITVLAASLRYAEATKGKYDPTYGAQSLARKTGKEPPTRTGTYKDIRIEGREVTLLKDGILLDLGSIAKGYIADRILHHLHHEEGVAEAFIDARGDLRTYGQHPERVAIAHPRGGEALRTLIIENKAVATSGDYRQYHERYEQNHIIGSKQVSVTVIADTLMEADVLATTLMLVDDEEATRLLAGTHAAALIIQKDGSSITHNGFETYEQ